MKNQIVSKIISEWRSIDEGRGKREMFTDQKGKKYYYNSWGKKVYPWLAKNQNLYEKED